MEAEEAPPSGSARDWSELPLDALASVFAKVGAIEILMGAGLVCHSWLRAAKVPYLWRNIHMEKSNINVVAERCSSGSGGRHVLRAMAKAAVDRAAGQLEVFIGEEFPDDVLLKYIGSRAPSFKVLGLTSCADILNEGFVKAINMFPLLEELKLSACGSICGRATYEAVGSACQNLNIFELIKDKHCRLFGTVQDSAEKFDADEAHGISTMHGLRSLKIYSSNITNKALAAIVGNCPDLESLDLHCCRNIVMDDVMLHKCAGIRITLHHNIDELFHDILL